MEIKISFGSNLTTGIRISAFETGALSTAVAYIDKLPPYTPGINVVLTVPNSVAHIIRIRELTAGVEGALVHPEILIEPTDNAIEISKPYQIIVGGTGQYDPADGAIEINIPELAGIEVSWVERRGVGNLQNPAEYIDLPTGGITLAPGDTFHAEETFFIQPPAKVKSVPAPATNSSIIFGGLIVISADTILNNTHLKKVIVAEANITLPAPSGVPENSHISIITPTLINKQITISGTVIKWANGLTNERSSLFMGSNERLVFYKNTGAWYVIEGYGNFDCVGERIYSDRILLNTFHENGNEYSLADYPRVAAHLEALEAGAVVSYTQWDVAQTINRPLSVQPIVFPNKGKWAKNTATGMFRVPDTRKNYRRALGSDMDVLGGIIPGAYQHHLLESHKHEYEDLAGESYTAKPVILRRGNGGNSPTTFIKVTNFTGGMETRVQGNIYYSLVKI